MLRLASILIIAALTAGYDTLAPIMMAAGAGALLALPFSYLVAQAIIRNKV